MKTIQTFGNNVSKQKFIICFLLFVGVIGCSKDDTTPTPKEVAKSSEKQITSFVFLLTNNPIEINVVATIDEGKKTITATMPLGTDITGLLPEVQLSKLATIDLSAAQNFTEPLVYTVTAEDGSKTIYTATITALLTQRQILQAILDANPGNTLNWDLQNTVDLSALDGVTTNTVGRITELKMQDKKLISIPSEIGQLTHLDYLGLNGNQLTSLPPEIGQLTNLTYLNLFVNQLTSLPPEIWQLTNLTSLDLGYNQLSTLSPEIGKLTNLTYLNLGETQLSTLPPEIGQLTNLTKLILFNNQLSTLPPEIVQLTNLTLLHLSNNQLSTLPPEIGQLTNLEIFYLNGNQLTSLPPEIGQLTNLTSLDLRDNQLSTLPPEIGQFTNLKDLILNNNQLTSIPAEIGQLTNLDDLRLNGNQLTSLPAEIGQLTNLTYLNLSKNQLSALPPEIGFISNLLTIRLMENNLTTIPQAICNLREYHRLTVNSDDNVTCSTTSQKDALISIYSANPGNTLNWGVDHYPGVGFTANEITLLNLESKKITRIPDNIDRITTLQTLNADRNNLKDISQISWKYCRFKCIKLREKPTQSTS